MAGRPLTHATPALFNSGTPSTQTSSCFLRTMKDDSIEGIFDTLRDYVLISKSAGGIGAAVSTIRAKGSDIRGTNGHSDGPVPMLRNFNETALYVHVIKGKFDGQCGGSTWAFGSLANLAGLMGSTLFTRG